MREETKIKGIYKSYDADAGGSLAGYVTASYADLVILLGDPNSEGDEYKVSTEWNLELEDGTQFRLYDYKETSLYASDLPSVEKFRAQKSYSWHLGGPNPGGYGSHNGWVNTVVGLISGGISELEED